MRAAMTQINVSARVYHCILKLSRTIADLARSKEIQSVHLAALTVCFAKALHASPSTKVDDGAIEFLRQFVLISVGKAVSLIRSPYY